MLVAQGRLRTPPGEDFAAAQGSLVVAGQARSIAAVDALRQIDDWGAEHAAAAVVRPGEVVARHGDDRHVFRWASVTKPVTALALLVAAEEGALDLDEPAGPPGSTVRHLLAHASGLPFTGQRPIAQPGERRIYSNTGFEVLAGYVGSARKCISRITCRRPCSSRSGWAELRGSPAADLFGTLDDLILLAQELLTPAVIAPETLAEATAVAFPGLSGVLPDFGRFEPNDWGLGFELRDAKEPHWTGTLQLAADLRPLRRLGDVPLGRPRAPARARLPHRPRVRTVGKGRVAAPVRRRPHGRGIKPRAVVRLVPQRTEFFELYRKAGANAVASRGPLVELLERFPDNPDGSGDIKELEHEGDRLTYDIVDLLNRTFVTPFDRDDMYRLASALDDICDHIDEAAGNILALRDRRGPAEGEGSRASWCFGRPRRSRKRSACSRASRTHARELGASRPGGRGRPSQPRGGLRALPPNDDAISVIRWKDIHEHLEEAVDACENAADVLEAIFVKNR